MIRVHMNPEISTQPKEYPTGTDWELTENGTLLVVAKSTYIAQFGVDTWTHVEIVQAGDAA